MPVRVNPETTLLEWTEESVSPRRRRLVLMGLIVGSGVLAILGPVMLLSALASASPLAPLQRALWCAVSAGAFFCVAFGAWALRRDAR